MTPLTPQRALEILAAYGGDSRRWPAGERDAMLALIARTPELAAARQEALAGDAALAACLQEAPLAPRPEAVAALLAKAGQTAQLPPQLHAPAPALRQPANDNRPTLWRRMAGGSIAAALIAGLVSLTPVGSALWTNGGSQSGNTSTALSTQLAATGTATQTDAVLTDEVALNLLFSDYDDEGDWM